MKRKKNKQHFSTDCARFDKPLSPFVAWVDDSVACRRFYRHEQAVFVRFYVHVDVLSDDFPKFRQKEVIDHSLYGALELWGGASYREQGRRDVVGSFEQTSKKETSGKNGRHFCLSSVFGVPGVPIQNQKEGVLII